MGCVCPQVEQLAKCLQVLKILVLQDAQNILDIVVVEAAFKSLTNLTGIPLKIFEETKQLQRAKGHADCFW